MTKTTAEPHLKKKTSFRDRLRWPTKPASGPEMVQEDVGPEPRFVYQPKHAAADFSRLAISHQAPRRRAEDQMVKSRRAQGSSVPGSADDVGIAAKPRGLTPQSRTPTENEAIVAVPGYSRSRKHTRQLLNAPSSVLRQLEQSTKPAPHLGSSRQPRKPTQNPWEASHAALYAAAAPADSGTPSTEEDDKLTSLNDFGLFIARAEAQDRAHRDKRTRARSTPQHLGTAVFPVVIKPNPHRQYASAAATSTSAPSAEGAVSSPSEASTPLARESLSRCEAERKRSSSSRNRTSGQLALAGEERHLAQGQGQGQGRGRPHRRENGERASWAPNPGSSVAERVAERKTAPRPPPVVVYGVDEKFQVPQQSRTLRGQPSIAQRVAEYIRPPKAASGMASGRESQGTAGPYRSLRSASFG
ncbi:hypothetical protein B0T25DRAFT_196152 [Lasiosphaeria hispida]|uniref:Uncharacterized protein n=1 Tax=Lasiosphaeria hispida TaxID=260671 RepID=A0AAJ0HI57_9PEZI|nr:hypothetical protein B0T25DRAFT_196152 [Lasiosphaeria hispida]